MAKTVWSESLTDVFEAAETFCKRVDEQKSLKLFISFYDSALREMFLRPEDEMTELTRTVWLDIIRWLVAYRIAKLRTMRDHLWIVVDLFLHTELDPWCTFTMTFGKTCADCPLVKHNAVKFERISNAVMSVDSFLRCKLANPAFREMVKVFQKKDFAAYKKLVQRQVFDNQAVKVWNAVRGRSKDGKRRDDP